MILHTFVRRMIKVMAIVWNSSHSYKQCGARLPSRYKLMATLSDPFPHDVPLHKAAQWARCCSLLFGIRWYIYAMAAGSWDKSMNILESTYNQDITILVLRLTNTIARSRDITWLWTKARSNPWGEACSDGTYVENIECGVCITFYSPRFGTQNRFSQPRWSTSDKSYLWYPGIYGVVRSSV